MRLKERNVIISDICEFLSDPYEMQFRQSTIKVFNREFTVIGYPLNKKHFFELFKWISDQFLT